MLKSEKVEKILSKDNYNFDDLCLILEILRGEGGCPWDTEQTHKSIRKNFIEETYEVLEAIDNEDTELLKEELGDVLLQVVFHTQMEKELGNFDIDGVSHEVCAKLINRHPHIFADVEAGTSEEVLNNWEAIKNVEKSRETVYDRISSVPPMLPALMRASKVSKKSGEFKEKSNLELIEEIEKQLVEIKKNPNTIEEKDFGNILFLLCSLSAKADFDAEESLFKTTNEFISKYKN